MIDFDPSPVGARRLIDLANPNVWPRDLIDFLEAHHDLLLGWECQNDDDVIVSARAFDRTIKGLCAILDNYFLTGWHCTRLTDAEICTLKNNGMLLPNLDLLRRRIDAIEAQGLIRADIANRLRSENQANDANRADMIWFCFYPPYIGGESGIERFFRTWGGEALYNSHERNPETGAALRTIGTPCLVEADVSNASFKEGSARLAFKIVLRFLISHGYTTTQPVEHDDRTIRPIPPENIRRIVKFPESDFIALTRCDQWRVPLSASASRQGCSPSPTEVIE